ncbi:monooxygenase [Amycolatopsis deserti]|uniref:Monooxygenase n=1 Tax=Amycolatopsis deserti TaxID=185696 RepID=A0ABQ3IB04_9PSEU|nr:LLM class flavin-dependent oxidoreductase [Amycolatopsis deserti]GHE76730.1 monooxygenase [Amycolatopsis deserti]
MSTIVQLALAVGDRVSLTEASALTALARDSGVASIRLLDGERTLDPTVVAAHLAGVHSGIGFVAEVPTTHHAPYNTARRVLSLDRATGGRAGIALLPGGGDEVSDATAPDPAAGDPLRRWREYAGVLTRLWESFPRRALIGDQAAAVVARAELIRPIGHEGAFYRVAGPLDGPSSPQGRPVLVADLGVLDPAAVAESADVVVVEQAAGADAALTDALRQAGRDRREVALLGRVPAGSPEQVLVWVHEHRLDGVELVPAGGAEEVAAVLRAWASEVAEAPSLRAALGLRAEVAA